MARQIKSMMARLAGVMLVAMAGTVMVAPDGAHAADLRIAMAAPPMLDPYYLWLDSNMSYNTHLYDPLTAIDENGTLVPCLATSWTTDGATKWRFTLRHGVTFHDGTPFTADDVVFSIARVPSIPNNPSPYTPYINTVTAVNEIDDDTVEFVTSRPNPVLPRQLAGLLMVSKHAAEGRSTADFSSGRVAIGTGPYKFTRYDGSSTLTLTANAAYWGKTPEWQTITFRVIANDASRISALLAGDVDLIGAVSPQDAAGLAKNAAVSLVVGAPTRVMFLGVNVGGINNPRLVNEGADNPLAKPEVRRAMSLALNRDALVRSLLDGYSRSASQVAIQGMIGYLDDVAPDPYDLEQARQLLRQAGYPNGFTTSLMCTNDRYTADAQTCAALSQMLARIGIKAAVDVVPGSVYFARVKAGANPQPLFLGGWSNSQGEILATLLPMFHSYAPPLGMGSANRTGWEDAQADHDIEAAQIELDQAKRVALETDAFRRGTESRIFIPLFGQPLLLASRKNVTYVPGTGGSSEMLLAMKAHPSGGQ